MSQLNSRAAILAAAWRNASDMAPVAFEALSMRERTVWQAVAAADIQNDPDVAPGDQWAVAVVPGKGARAKPQIVLTAPNAEMVLSGEVSNDEAAQALVDAGRRGFRIE